MDIVIHPKEIEALIREEYIIFIESHGVIFMDGGQYPII